MNYSDQLQLNALLQEFLEEGDTFDPEKAKQFRDLLPNSKPQRFIINANMKLPSLGAKGLTNTGHDANVGDDEKKKLSYSNEKQGTWVGSWDLKRVDEGDETTIYIKQRFAETKEEEPDDYTLEFQKGDPVAMFKSERAVWNLLIFRVIRVTMAAYKRPA